MYFSSALKSRDKRYWKGSVFGRDGNGKGKQPENPIIVYLVLGDTRLFTTDRKEFMVRGPAKINILPTYTLQITHW
ncbi:hypothetical protein EYC84_008980 [Monilinia fructicola]|uniref:Uncharacterized protein n=1 Tax=Monilinia fructicola TaxID=38448 RepID=A0A5M9JAS1_MONFR|nr:hypothetical protein EYC84_008980 [Monilinia fructicola]